MREKRSKEDRNEKVKEKMRRNCGRNIVCTKKEQMGGKNVGEKRENKQEERGFSTWCSFWNINRNSTLKFLSLPTYSVFRQGA